MSDAKTQMLTFEDLKDEYGEPDSVYSKHDITIVQKIFEVLATEDVSDETAQTLIAAGECLFNGENKAHATGPVSEDVDFFYIHDGKPDNYDRLPRPITREVKLDQKS
jgi:hypothetical protein